MRTYISSKSILLGLLLTAACFLSANAAPADFKVKAFYIDCRTQVMTVNAIKQMADDLSGKGINTIMIEYEATFPFQQNATLCNRWAYTRSEVQEIVSHCQSRGIEIIPLQNCFGHCEYILRHDRYAALREDRKEVSQVCPLRIEEAKSVFQSIFSEVAALHSSRYMHIGGDETYLLGSCERCSKVDKSRLFVDYINAMCTIVKGLGKQPIIWADMILKYPEAAKELPKDLIYVDWNYGWEPDRFGKLENLKKLGVTIWGATALRSSPDNAYLTQWMKHFNNLKTFLPFARENGYEGMIETSWSTSGTYGFHYDEGWEVTGMQPIRQVYPMSGFRILSDACCAALQSDTPLDPETFIMNRGREYYGLSESDAKILLSYFLLPQETVRNGKDPKGRSVSEMIGECQDLKARFDRLRPTHHPEEFAHNRLMLDLRINYLQFKQVEAERESTGYDGSRRNELLRQLKQIMKDAKQLDRRFIRLNKDYLKPCQLEYINESRNEKMNELYQTISGVMQ